ncbi:hypothetical protein D3C84_454750 [compost metagenome]
MVLVVGPHRTAVSIRTENQLLSRRVAVVILGHSQTVQLARPPNPPVKTQKILFGKLVLRDDGRLTIPRK